jgi:putative restriction endonuclease
LRSRNWSRDELLACFNLYCRIPFGKLHKGNPEIIEAAEALHRTPSAVAMKLVNFASFDPAQRSRNVKGLVNVSRQDRALWEQFEVDPNTIAARSEEAFDRFIGPGATLEEEVPAPPGGPTEKLLERPMRLVQSFFRRAVLASYGYRCCFCKLDVVALLNASHIVPWNASVELRADPRNGLCLCALHDRAFDRGLVGVDATNRVVISERLSRRSPPPLQRVAFFELEGTRIALPARFQPLQSSLEHHRRWVFK